LIVDGVPPAPGVPKNAKALTWKLTPATLGLSAHARAAKYDDAFQETHRSTLRGKSYIEYDYGLKLGRTRVISDFELSNVLAEFPTF
jgi:hypothetical protein